MGKPTHLLMYRNSFNLLVSLLLIPLFSFAQEGIVSGILTTETDGLPLPGASIIIKGTSIGVQTDFDGKYSLKCHVDDILIISYIGMSPREVKVTAEMFGIEQQTYVERISAKPIETDAYANALKRLKKNEYKVPHVEEAQHRYNKNGAYNQFNRIETLNIDPEHVILSYFKPDIYFEVGVNSNLSFQFVKDKNLPQLQSQFSQGATENGTLTFLGPETGNVFSYGPNLNALEYDGSNYSFDENGKLVPLGDGNGKVANAYDNSILNTTVKTFQNVFFNVDAGEWSTGLDYSHKTSEDIFGQIRSNSDNITLKFNSNQNYNRKLGWEAFVKYGNQINNQPNINGFANNLLLNTWITPVTFENAQGNILQDNSQRSFSPANYNNLEWLLSNNRNYDKNDLFVASLQNNFRLSDDIIVKSNINYKHIKNEQNFGVVSNTIGFENGYLSNKIIKKKDFNAVLSLDYDTYLGNYSIDVSSTLKFNNENLDYQFKESEGFSPFSFSNPSDISFSKNMVDRNLFRLRNHISLSYDHDTKISFTNSAYVSSIQNNEWLLPTSVLQVDLSELLDIYDFHDLILSVSSSFDVNDMPLFYNNLSHNSLQSNPSESLSYTANNDLFINENIELEQKHNYAFNAIIGFHFLDLNWDITTTYFGSKTEGSVFPVFVDGAYQFQNIADISNKGFELTFEVGDYRGDLKWNTRFNFTTNQNEVLKIYSNDERIPIAGFNSISKNLIVGESAGVIVGSAYARDNENNIIIDADGFPIVDSEQQIIGDPIPDFTIGFSNAFSWKNLRLKFTVDYQKGGDVWNGTQNVLNYFGTSQQSANQRIISNYIFNGVNEQGNVNTVAVDFYNPANGVENNRFVRYGFDGVAEDAIEDGSFLNVRTIELSYDFSNENNYNFFRQFEIGIYANNLFTITKYRGASPYSSLYDTNSGNNLNFFNTPLITEVGLKANLKI